MSRNDALLWRVVCTLLIPQIVVFVPFRSSHSFFCMGQVTNTTLLGDEITNTTAIDYEQENILALRWKLIYTGVSYDGLRFDVHYTVSDYIVDNLVQFTVYDGPECSTEKNNIITEAGFFYMTLNDGSGNSPYTQGSGLDTREMKLSAQINPETITRSMAYREKSNLDASIDFCIRFTLYNKDISDVTATEVNHLTTSISLMVDLTDDFSIKSHTVQAQDVGVETADDAFFVEGFLCESDGSKLVDTQIWLQGEMVRVCVQPTQQAIDIGFRMRSIDRFTFAQGYITQDAVVNGRQSVNHLTDLFCDEGSIQCSFETLLSADFYKGPSTVDGEGMASLQFGDANDNGNINVRMLQDYWEDYAYDEELRRELKSSKTFQLPRFPIEKNGHLLSQAWSGAPSCRLFQGFFGFIIPSPSVVTAIGTIILFSYTG